MHVPAQHSEPLTRERVQSALVAVLDHALPVAAGVERRLVGTAAALLQGVDLPVGGVEIEVSTVEWETDSDAVECTGRGPWEG